MEQSDASQIVDVSPRYKFPYHDIVIGHRNGKDIFYILSMEAVPLAGSYDLLIGSITAFCSETDRPRGKKYICGGYRFYLYDNIRSNAKSFSLSLDQAGRIPNIYWLNTASLLSDKIR